MVTWVEPTVADDSATVSLQGAHRTGDVFPIAVTTVAHVAVDGSGKRTEASFAVRVTVAEGEVDVEAPALRGEPDAGSGHGSP